jgi:ABC-type xylose transport system permease subunit
MLDILLFGLICVLAVRAFIALRRESVVMREFAHPVLLGTLVLLCPLGPVALLIGPHFLPAPAIFLCVAVLFVTTVVVASRQRNMLERSGTDKTDAALAAVSSASLTAIIGIIYLVLLGTYTLFVFESASHPFGT